MRRAFLGLVAAVLVVPACWAQSTAAQSKFVPVNGAPIINRLLGALPPAPAVTAPSALSSTAPTASNGIAYNGGPIMDDANGVNVYFIWYGDWSKDQLAQKVLVNLITHIGGSPYFNINTTYYSLEPGPNINNPIKDRVVNAVHYMGNTTDNYSQGTSPSDQQVFLAVANAITSGALPVDKNGVYFLLTSADVNAQGYSENFCAWHGNTGAGPQSIDGTDIKVSWVGNAAALYAYNCIWNYQTTLSGSMGADGMASLIAHELEESVTDPDGTSWINLGNGFFGENADMCLAVFPGSYHSGSASDPQPPDMKFGGIPYLIQENWVNAKGGLCAIKWDD